MDIPMTVMQINGRETEFVIINLRDVDFIESESRKIVYHIGDEKFYQATTKSELDELLNDAGFDALDRPYLVNMEKIRYFDKEYGKVYFNDSPLPNSKFVTVAKVKEKIVENYIRFGINEKKEIANELILPRQKRIHRWFSSILKGDSE